MIDASYMYIYDSVKDNPRNSRVPVKIHMTRHLYTLYRHPNTMKNEIASLTSEA